MDRRLQYLEKYINKELAPFLGLHHWVFHISEEQGEEGDWAEINVDDFDEATVKVGTKFWSATPQLKTQALIHELMHIPVVRINEDLELAIESLTVLLSEKKKAVVKDQITIHLKAAGKREEQFVNLLGVILSPHAPKWKPPTK